MFAIIVLFSQSFDEFGFTYEIPENLNWQIYPWMIVKVPFWKKETFWVVTKILNKNEENFKTKKIIWIYSEDIFLSDWQIKIYNFLTEKYFCLAHQAISVFLPTNLKNKILKEKFTFSQSRKGYNYSFNYSKKLNQNQTETLEKIINSEKNKFLLFWVTWSWKTEIYIKIIKHNLENNKQTLLLVPEIILTSQIRDRIENVFWKDIITISSDVSAAKKTDFFNDIHQNKAKIIIWTRSALFYPYKDLWSIIIDEEHDNSYISDNSPKYSTVEVANKISDLINCKLILWSWTPKITHLYDWLKWKYEVLYLFREFQK